MAEVKEIKKKTGGQNFSSVRRSSSRKKKRGNMPHWIYVICAALLSAFFLAVAYYIYFRPYLYRFRPCYGQRHYEICLPLGYSVYGIDVSRHQGTIDWKRLKREMPKEAPVSFVFIKATEGSDFTDANFKTNFEEAGKQGFIRGAYHYFGTQSTGMAQAEMYIKTVKLNKGDLPPVIDVEERPKDKTRFLQELKIFISKIEEHYGVRPIIYSYKKFKERYLSESFFNKYPLWIAHYYVSELDEEIEWLMWQCSDMGSVPGIETNVDINIFNGNMEQLKSLRIK